MKVFFDTNVYIAESLLGAGAERMISAARQLRWRIYANSYLLDEIERVLVEKLGFSSRSAAVVRARINRFARCVPPTGSKHFVPKDPKDNPILQSAVAAGVDYLITNDVHLLELHPYQGIRIVSMSEFLEILINEGNVSP